MQKKNNILLQYAGMGFGMLAAIGLAVFVGIKLDNSFGFSIPLLVWVLPLLIIITMMYKTIKDTSSKK